MITAGGIALPSPIVGGYDLSLSTLVDGGRNAQGQFVGQVIGDDKLKITGSFGNLTQEEFQRFLRLFDRNFGGAFVQRFTVFDPRVGDFVVKEMYVGDRTGKALALDGLHRPTMWGDIKASLIEV